MTRKKTKKVPKTDAVWKLSKEEATLANKPRYNAYAYGSGAHGDTQYNRTKQKRSWKRELDNERASYRGPLPVILCHAYTALAGNVIKSAQACVLPSLIKLFFNTEQLIVLSNAVRTTRSTCLDLASISSNRQVGNSNVFGFTGAM